MSTKYAFLFPGQGSQTPGMLKDVCQEFEVAKNCINHISSIIGEDICKLLWESDSDVLSRTDNSQLAITASSLAILEVLKLKGIIPSAVMGFSLGEFSALYASGVLSFEDTIEVVRNRGKIMQAVCEEIASTSNGKAPGMAAVIGLEQEKIVEIAKLCNGVYVANMNSSRQTVISATFDGLSSAEEKFKASGARRFIRLAVAGPFHSPLMQKAASEFEKAIENVTFNNPKIPLFSNVTGKIVASGVEAKKNAVLHLINPVLWTDEENAIGSMINESCDCWKVLEVGVGKVLTGLWRDTSFSQNNSCIPIGTAEAINSL